MTWCGSCYRQAESDNFQINQLKDEDGNVVYDCESDKDRYKVGIDGSHLMTNFQCDVCVFRTLYQRNPRRVVSDSENLVVIRRMNLDSIWSREPSTIRANMGHLANLITTCEASGFTPQLPRLGPFPIKDNVGYCVAFSMLVQSRRPGRHSKSYTQFDTIRKQRSAFSNLFNASQEVSATGQLIASGAMTNGHITTCPTNSMWFGRWQLGCHTRMGYIIKQNKAISLDILNALVESFKSDISQAEPLSWNRRRLTFGLGYSILTFAASLRGSEGLKVDLDTLKQYVTKGKHEKKGFIIVPTKGRFKGEKGERCHLLALSNISHSGIAIRSAMELLIAARNEMTRCSTSWLFVNQQGTKMSFGDMNDIVLDQLELVKELDAKKDRLKLQEFEELREEFSINRSFRRGSSTHAQNRKIPVPVIDTQNRWRKVERAKGRRPKFSMIENYSDIEQLIPTMVQYSDML